MPRECNFCPLTPERAESLEKTLQRIEVMAARIEERQKNHHHELFGNGKRGLITRVDVLERFENQRLGRAGVISGIVALIVAIVVGVAVNWYDNRDEYRLQHQPSPIVGTPAR